MTDSDLIFLVSQPRAGSTMVQRMLGRHERIHTTTEPWLMLEPVQAFRGANAEADHAAGGWSGKARDTFLNTIANGQVVDEGLKQFGLHVYAEAIAGTDKTLFLDKTPRYYGILPELGQIFPEARFIVLMRNPLSVLCSILRTWVQDHWGRLSSYRFDLLNGPRDLVNGIGALGELATLVHYEKIIENPQDQIAQLCQFLGVETSESMFAEVGEERFAFGDPVSAASRVDVAADHSARWLEDVQHPQIWRLAHDYLDHLDAPLLAKMGYDRAELSRQLASRKPMFAASWMTHSLDSLLTPGAIAEKAGRS